MEPISDFYMFTILFLHGTTHLSYIKRLQYPFNNIQYLKHFSLKSNQNQTVNHTISKSDHNHLNPSIKQYGTRVFPARLVNPFLPECLRRHRLHYRASTDRTGNGG